MADQTTTTPTGCITTAEMEALIVELQMNERQARIFRAWDRVRPLARLQDGCILFVDELDRYHWPRIMDQDGFSKNFWRHFGYEKED